MSETMAEPDIIHDYMKATNLVWSLAGALMETDGYHKLPADQGEFTVPDGIDLRVQGVGELMIRTTAPLVENEDKQKAIPPEPKAADNYDQDLGEEHTAIREFTVVNVPNDGQFMGYEMPSDISGKIPFAKRGEFRYEEELPKVLRVQELLQRALRASLANS